MMRRKVLGITVLLIACTALGWARLAGMKLYMNGRIVSTAVITSNGVAYVPVKDMAAAMEMTAENRADGFALVRAGGATQVQGSSGKIGNDLFNGFYKFKVVKVERGLKYMPQFNGTKEPFVAREGFEYAAVICRLKNGKKTPVLLSPFGRSKTALTDEEEHAYETLTGLVNDAPGRGVSLLPGAASDFALLFQVPANAVLKDLVYEVDDVTVANRTFRISLKP